YSSVTSLRDVSPKQMHSVTEQLGDLLLRRCRHVITEIERVKTVFDALNSGDIETVGQLVSRSHSSLRDDFEVSCDEVESLVSITNACKGVLGSRMVGAGFGGCVLSIVQAVHVEAVRQQIAQEYRTNNGKSPWMHTVASTMPAAEYSAT
ncbi:MAG: galactokinase, partial [Woeseiales bacterium]